MERYEVAESDLNRISQRLSELLQQNGLSATTVAKRADELKTLASDEGTIVLNADGAVRSQQSSEYGEGMWRWSFRF